MTVTKHFKSFIHEHDDTGTALNSLKNS